MLDKSVGSVIAALREKHMLEDSIVIFMSDNGAAPEGVHANHGSNYPFRGVSTINNKLNLTLQTKTFCSASDIYCLSVLLPPLSSSWHVSSLIYPSLLLWRDLVTV